MDAELFQMKKIANGVFEQGSHNKEQQEKDDAKMATDLQMEEDLGKASFDQLFSTRNPRDAQAGLSSGLKSITKGVVGGVASLIALPVHGAKEEGVLGGLKGLGLGVVSAVGLITVGAGTGIWQIGRGIVNTPAAISAKIDDKVWDEEKRIWYYYSVDLHLNNCSFQRKLKF